jgi:hypothetical protein
MRHQYRRALVALALITSTVAAVGTGAPAIAAAPAPGAERNITTARPANRQANAAVAWNGSVYLVVWEEHFANGDPPAIFGARVSATGTVLDPTGFRISTGSSDGAAQLAPAVAAGDGGFMVVWVDAPEGTYTDLDAAIVGGDGAIVRSEWAFRHVDNGQYDPSIAWNGSRYLVTWEDGPDPSDPDIFAARAYADGSSYDACSYESCLDDEYDWPGLPIRATLGEVDGSHQTKPVVAAVGSRFHIAWEDTETTTVSDVRGARFQLGGVMDDPPFTIASASGAQEEPAIAANGENLLTVWTDRRGGTGRDVWGDVSVLGDGADFRIGGGTGAQYEPTVTGRGSGYLVAWTDTRRGNADIFTSRVTAGGVVSEPSGVAAARSAAPEFGPALASGTGNRQLLVYTKSSTTGGPDRIKFRVIA